MYDYTDEWKAAQDDAAWDAFHAAEEAAQDEYLASLASCPACGQFIDYCQGHGELGDYEGHLILVAHDEDDHSGCHSAAGCVEPEYI